MKSQFLGVACGVFFINIPVSLSANAKLPIVVIKKRKLAAKSDQLTLKQLYELGMKSYGTAKTPHNHSVSYGLFLRAAQQDCAAAPYNLEVMCEHGLGIFKN